MFCPISPVEPMSLPPTMKLTLGSFMPASEKVSVSAMPADVSPPIPSNLNQGGAADTFSPNSAALAREMVL